MWLMSILLFIRTFSAFSTDTENVEANFNVYGLTSFTSRIRVMPSRLCGI